jgi:Tol biopolymer transport system component/DNA-binding winged helix-turn-helix (wHTH) protein
MPPTIATKSFVFTFADVTVREREFAIVRAGQVQQVEPKAFRVLLILIRNPNKLIAKEELLTGVWGDTAVTENSLARNIALLRRLLGDDPREPRFIATVSSIGYRFLCEAEVSEDAAGFLEPTGQLPVNGKAAEVEAHLQESSRRPKLWLLVGAVSAVAIATPAWWLFFPHPQPRVTNITQVTNDGLLKAGFVTDGSRIYYASVTKEGVRFYQVSTQGGEPVAMRELDGMSPLDISADRSELLLARAKDHTLWVAPVVGTGPRPLTGIVASEAKWSPSGTEIAFTYTAQKEIRIARSDGSDSRTLVTAEGLTYGPSWYPDGSKLVFSAWTEDIPDSSLWEVSANGTGMHRLFPQWTDYSQWYGSWTRDRKYFVFMAADPARPYQWDIWAVKQAGATFGSSRNTPVRLTTGPLRINGPALSPDGKRIFFYGVLDRVELVRYDLGTKQWVPYLSGLSAEQLDFSRDGKLLAYSSYPENYLFRSDADGGHKLRLTPPTFQGIFGNPRFSPDGTQIAFSASRPGESSRAYVETAEGDGLRKLTNGECGHNGESDPVWSPDGAFLIFGCLPDGPKAGLNRDSVVIRMIDLKTHQISVLPGSQGLWSPRWSPNGRYLIAMSFPLPADLVLYDTQTHVRRKLFTPKNGGWPAWSRDGQYAYVKDGIAEYRVRISDGALEQVADLTSLKDVSWAGITPDGSVIAIRNTGNVEIYALDWDAP